MTLTPTQKQQKSLDTRRKRLHHTHTHLYRHTAIDAEKLAWAAAHLNEHPSSGHTEQVQTNKLQFRKGLISAYLCSVITTAIAFILHSETAEPLPHKKPKGVGGLA